MFAAHACENQGALDELATIKESACKCADADCAQKVNVDFEAWAKKYADVHGSPEADQAGKIANDISDCMVKAMGGGGDEGDDEGDDDEDGQ